MLSEFAKLTQEQTQQTQLQSLHRHKGKDKMDQILIIFHLSSSHL